MSTILLDFDQTLLDTVSLKKAQFKAIKPFLIEKTEKYTNEQAKKVIKKYKCYTHKKHLQYCVAPENYKDAVKAYEKVINKTKQFLYPDTLNFLKKHQRKYNLVLLSYGDATFQKLKIKLCNFDKYPTYITQDIKYKEFPKIKKRFSGPFYFIEDRGKEIDPFKKKYPEVTMYWMRRHNGEDRNKPCKNFDHKISNLNINL